MENPKPNKGKTPAPIKPPAASPNTATAAAKIATALPQD